jgi:hypothetical protein
MILRRRIFHAGKFRGAKSAGTQKSTPWIPSDILAGPPQFGYLGRNHFDRRSSDQQKDRLVKRFPIKSEFLDRENGGIRRTE